MRVFVPILTVSLVFPFMTASAQQPPALELGTRVRVTQECREGYSLTSTGLATVCPAHVGVLNSVTSDSIVLETGEGYAQTRLALAAVTSIEVSRGRRSRIGRGALTGLGVGIGVGALVGAAVGGASGSCTDTGDSCPAFGAAVGAVIFGIPGLVIGTISGATQKTDRWEEVPLDRLGVSFARQRDGRFVLRVSVSL